MPAGLRATLKTWNIEAQEKSVDEVSPWFQASTDDENRLARAFAAQTVTTARLLKAVRKKWGHLPETAIAHICLTETPEDDDAAIVTIAGDRVTLQFQVRGISSLYLVRTNGAWRVDMAAYVRGFGARLETIVTYCDRSSEVFEKITAAINSGDFSTAQNAIDALKKELGPLERQL